PHNMTHETLGHFQNVRPAGHGCWVADCPRCGGPASLAGEENAVQVICKGRGCSPAEISEALSVSASTNPGSGTAEHTEPPEEAPAGASRGRPDGSDGSDGKSGTPKPPIPKTQAQQLLRLAEGAERFHTPDGTGYATIVVAHHRETWPI